MPVAIKEVHIQNLGPHRQLSLQFSRFNLVFGHNENGKTYLVEFIIRSLFRQAQAWGLRSQKGKGKVVVSGLSGSDANTVDFSPASTKKLEDFWDENKMGLPPDFSRLLVVKGAEVEIVHGPGGIDKNMMKRLLSGKNTLEHIEGRISKTLRKSRLINNEPDGPRSGEIKNRDSLKSLLTKYDELFAQIDSDYSGGYRVLLLEQKKKLQRQIDELIAAKRHLAYKIDQEMQRLGKEMHRISAEDIQKARAQLALYRQKELEYNQKLEEFRDAEAKSKHYEWLKAASELYQSSLQRATTRPTPYLLVLALLFVGAAGLLTVLDFPMYAILALAGVLVFGLLYFRTYRALLAQAGTTDEFENLKRSFKDKFKENLTDLPQILALLKEQEDNFNTSRILRKQLEEDLNRQEGLRLSISDQIYELAGERKDPGSWDEVLRLLQNQVKKTEERIQKKDRALARLDVDPSDYRIQEPDVLYSKEKLDELQRQLHETEEAIEAEEKKLTSLKQRICDQTGDDMTSSWEEVIEHLRTKRSEALSGYKEKTAEIIGKLAVLEIINELKRDEDKKLLAGLKSQEVQQPLFQVTNRYKSIDFDNDELVVSDSFDDFPVAELSTGAQEQILLALRIGFAAKIAGRNSLFLILDDAFQYSDWQRRNFLIDKVLQLANDGWQVIYFTMDDHIRQLFDEAGKAFGDEYRFVEFAGE
ncbi:MAG: ATP-binding protein [bacterium]